MPGGESNPLWYIRRLRAMGPREIIARTRRALMLRAWRARSDWAAPQASLSALRREPLPACDTSSPETRRQADALIAEADRTLRGEYELLGIGFRESPIDWHRDPQTGVTAPLAFGPGINYRDPAIAGNVKNIWEKNRHHHLTQLAAAYHLTGDDRYAQAAANQLHSWVEHNPVARGINWTSALELGVRLIAWVWIEKLIRRHPAHTEVFGVNGRLWPSIYWHQYFCDKLSSHGSSANNHLIGELAGLFCAADAWPVFPESRQWRQRARQGLERETVNQTYPSGLNREHGAGYHLFTFELLATPMIQAQASGDPFAPDAIECMRRMIRVMPSLMDRAGHWPNFGDGDDGTALRLTASHEDRVADLMSLGQRWLGIDPLADGPIAHLRPEPQQPTLYTRLLTADLPQRSDQACEIVNPTRPHDAGYITLSSDRGQADEWHVIADAAPLGYLATAAHGHADALSFTLSVAGQPVIIDPGTYVYHASPDWRHYFRSTAAHNTIELDGENQSVSGGLFLWSKHAQTTRQQPQDFGGSVFEAEHDGYTRRPGAPIHRRRLQLESAGLTIKDELIGGGDHRIAWRLHFHPDQPCTLDTTGDTPRAVLPCGVSVRLDPALFWRVERGADSPIAGWYAPAFNQKQPTDTLIGEAELSLPRTLTVTLERTDR